MITGGITGRDLKDTKIVDGNAAIIGVEVNVCGGCVMLSYLMFVEAHFSKQIACMCWVDGVEDDSWDEMIESGERQAAFTL